MTHCFVRIELVGTGRLRISAISYLNTAPLIWDFEHGEAGQAFDISYTVPSQCAAQLNAGTVDIGLIPSAAYVTVPDLVVLPGVAIASKRAVRSILLVSKVPVEEIRRVALDTSSLTSVALTKVLFEKLWGGPCEFIAKAPDLQQMLSECDAGVLIGDPALKVDRTQYVTYDLADEWIRLTGKPFVFAFWAVRQEALGYLDPSINLARVFQESRDHGLDPHNLDTIAVEWAPRLGLTEDAVKSYLTQNIFYHLDQECLDGLHLFYRYAAECKAVMTIPTLHFLDAEKPAVI
jgi:chorismate dehydratase